MDCCDSTLFLGGKSNSTNKEIAEMIGKQTINQMTYGESTGQSGSASKNLQIQGRDLIDAAEIGKMKMCIRDSSFPSPILKYRAASSIVSVYFSQMGISFTAMQITSFLLFLMSPIL